MAAVGIRRKLSPRHRQNRHSTPRRRDGIGGRFYLEKSPGIGRIISHYVVDLGNCRSQSHQQENSQTTSPRLDFDSRQ